MQSRARIYGRAINSRGPWLDMIMFLMCGMLTSGQPSVTMGKTPSAPSDNSRPQLDLKNTSWTNQLLPRKLKFCWWNYLVNLLWLCDGMEKVRKSAENIVTIIIFFTGVCTAALWYFYHLYAIYTIQMKLINMWKRQIERCHT